MKRFTETQIYSDPWYRKLPIEIKAFWDYITRNCDNAGVWKVDMEAVEFHLGVKIDKAKALELLNGEGKQRIHTFDNDRKWLIINFVEFQYGELSPANNLHKSVLKLLKSHGLIDIFEGLMRASIGPQEKEKEKVKVKVKEERGSAEGETAGETPQEKSPEQPDPGEIGPGKYSQMRSVTDREIEDVVRKTGRPRAFVLDVWKRLQLYVKSTGKPYHDYHAALESWVRREKDPPKRKRGIIEPDGSITEET